MIACTLLSEPRFVLGTLPYRMITVLHLIFMSSWCSLHQCIDWALSNLSSLMRICLTIITKILGKGWKPKSIFLSNTRRDEPWGIQSLLAQLLKNHQAGLIVIIVSPTMGMTKMILSLLMCEETHQSNSRSEIRSRRIYNLNCMLWRTRGSLSGHRLAISAWMGFDTLLSQPHVTNSTIS